MVAFAASGLACIRGERLVFADVRFRLENGGALVLVGPNGAGKSSLLRLMAGLLPAAGGALLWDEAPVADDPEAHRRRLRYVGHAEAIKPSLTAGENLAFWARFGGGAGDLRERCRRALAGFAIEDLEEVPARFLSAGQKRRLALARLLLAPAPLWLLDEPRTALDDAAARRLDQAIAAHRAAGGLVVLALHGSERPPAADVLDLTPFMVERHAW